MPPRKTIPRQIMEARHAIYARYPEGYYDETDLLLMSQDVGIRLARAKRRKKRKKKSLGR
jgi:hypothetical protein